MTIVKPSSTGGGSAAAESGQCERWLSGATAMLEPGSLGRTTDADKAALLLSQYLEQEGCTGVPPGPVPLDPGAAETVSRLLGEGAIEEVTGRRMSAGDARFLRTRLMDAAAVAGVISSDAPPETVAVALNRSVARRLFPPYAAREPGTTYEARLRGEGDWADRAWLLADLLRQVGLDSVLLTPWGEGDPREKSAWVGVLLPGEILLFDMRTGLPVPSAGDADRPARLAEVRTDDATRAAVTAFYETAGLPVPDEAAVNELAPRLIGEPGWWRMANGLFTLTADDAGGPDGGGRTAATFDPLHDRPNAPGLVSRVAAAGFDADSVTVWPVPGERAAESGAGVPETLAAPLRIGLRPPGGVQLDPETGQMRYDPEGAEAVTAASDGLWRARHEQLAGGRDGARRAAASLDALLKPEEPGTLLSDQPLPPVSERDLRASRGEIARSAADGRAAGSAPDRPTDLGEADVQAILRAAVDNGVAPWPVTGPLARPVPDAVLAAHAAALPEAIFFLGEVQADRGRFGAAGPLFGALLGGDPTVRKGAAASRVAEMAAADGDPATAVTLARQFVGGPDGPRLKVWIDRWSTPASGGRQPPEPSTDANADDPQSDDANDGGDVE